MVYTGPNRIFNFVIKKDEVMKEENLRSFMKIGSWVVCTILACS